MSAWAFEVAASGAIEAPHRLPFTHSPLRRHVTPSQGGNESIVDYIPGRRAAPDVLLTVSIIKIISAHRRLASPVVLGEGNRHMAEVAQGGRDLLGQSRIRGWHTVASDAETKSVASRLCIVCTETLKALRKPLAARGDFSRSLFRSYGRSCNALFLWIDGYGIHAGGLDKHLDASWILRKLMFQFLTRVCDLVTEGEYRTCCPMLLRK